jgi:hypothetical protein
MILVDKVGGVYPRIDHAPWDGCTLADFVMPFFLFIVGVAIALALKVRFPFSVSFCLVRPREHSSHGGNIDRDSNSVFQRMKFLATKLHDNIYIIYI